MEIGPSGVPFSYTTIMATKSRIDKGLLAIPVSLVDFFPKTSGSVYLLSESGRWVRKSFTAYDSTSRECRIGGMSDFYERYDVHSGDELVLHVHGNGRYQNCRRTCSAGRSWILSRRSIMLRPQLRRMQPLQASQHLPIQGLTMS